MLDVDLVPDVIQSKVDISRRESDHFPLLTIIRRQPSARPSTIDTADGGRPLPRLSWASGCRESYVERLDARSLNVRKGLVDDTKVHITVYIPIDGRYTLDP